MRLSATRIALPNWAPKVSLLGPTYLNYFVLLHRSWLKSVKTNVRALLISCSSLTVRLGLSTTWFTGDGSSLFGFTSLNLVISCAICLPARALLSFLPLLKVYWPIQCDSKVTEWYWSWSWFYLARSHLSSAWSLAYLLVFKWLRPSWNNE